MPRATADLVVLILAGTVAVVLVLVVVGLVVFADPDDSTVRALAESAGSLASIMVGIVVGFVLRGRKDGA